MARGDISNAITVCNIGTAVRNKIAYRHVLPLRVYNKRTFRPTASTRRRRRTRNPTGSLFRRSVVSINKITKTPRYADTRVRAAFRSTFVPDTSTTRRRARINKLRLGRDYWYIAVSQLHPSDETKSDPLRGTGRREGDKTPVLRRRIPFSSPRSLPAKAAGEG